MKKIISILYPLFLSLFMFSMVLAEELVSEEIIPEQSYVYQVPDIQVVEMTNCGFEELVDGSDSVDLEDNVSADLPVVEETSPTGLSSTTITGYYNSIRGADIRWKKVNNATGYILYRQRSAEGTVEVARITDRNTVQYFDESIQDNCWGRVYVYYVCAMFGTEVGPESNKVTLQRLAPMKITKSSGSTDGTINLTWSCSTGSNKAEGYEIHIAESWPDLSNRNGSFATITVEGRNNLSEGLAGLTVGRTYHIRIRSYVNYTHSVTGKKTKTWSQFSDVVRVKIPVATPTPTPRPTATATPRPTTAPQVATYQYVLNKNSHVFHYSWCASVKRMSARNKWFYTGNRNQVIAMGYRACHNCKP